ncbi:hypothetical protein E3U43_001393, partial [Larimichthys crocea]
AQARYRRRALPWLPQSHLGCCTPGDPKRCLAEWDIIAMEIEAMTLAHARTHARAHSHGLRNETGFHERAAAQSDSMKSCLSKGKTAAWIELSLEGNSALLFHPS